MALTSRESCKQLTRKSLEEFIKEKKTDTRAQAFFVKDYVHDCSVTFHDTLKLCFERKTLLIYVKVQEAA